MRGEVERGRERESRHRWAMMTADASTTHLLDGIALIEVKASLHAHTWLPF